MKTLNLFLIVSMLFVLSAGAAMAQYTYPTVTFQHEASSWSYIYTVTVTPDDSFPLGYLELDTLVKNAGETAWTMLGPVANGADLNWTKTWFEWQEGCDAANWYVDSGQQAIVPSAWVGVFTLIAPNTVPGEGFGLTMCGAKDSDNSFTVYVPGPQAIVPEPSSMLALGSGFFGICGMLLRRRQTS